jgi:hypothetical protein
MKADIQLNLSCSLIDDSVDKAKFLPWDRSIVQIQDCPTTLSLFHVNYQSY